MASTMSSAPDLQNLKVHNVGDGKDMISDLHGDILHYILSLLPTKDVIRTSVLATKWRYLWTNLSVFDFEIGYVVSYDSKSKPVDYLFDQVDKLLHKSNCVERLCISTQRVFVGVGKVSTFISSVVKHKVQDLKISVEYLEGTYVLPNRFTASYALNKLHLEFPCTLHIPSGICFPGLKTLVVSNVIFGNEKSVERLFLGCPVLQELTLDNCYWMNTRDIHFAISTLRKLTIYSDHCYLDYNNHSDKCTITIDVENLLSLCCTSNPEVEFFLVKPTSIVDAYIHLGCFNPKETQVSGQRAIELLSGLSSVKSLKLSEDFLQVCFVFFFPRFSYFFNILLRFGQNCFCIG
ncbi:putative F-box domain, leucine-rich repeat domain, L domain-containing protein [Medicago truncatula]|uniref:Putative F-box domain, leucine-rich repeat domain, L domain-containing protein n=1 Tax=Medicago truncatula TaxID=3880 RepID=A0A396H0U4_MEDTR|nr:putative F-box domain, leucine-rich repeat domain, L domain-containing protein [Medicago truncatula]